MKLFSSAWLAPVLVLAAASAPKHIAAHAASAAAAAHTDAAPAVSQGLDPAVIMRAQENLSYTGTLLINGSQRARVEHDAGDRQRQEFLRPDGSVGDVVVTDGSVRWHWMSRLNTVKVMPMDSNRGLEQRLALMRKNYHFQVMGQTHQAGRVVLLTQFSPVHHGNMTHRLWVDLETHLPLVVERRDANGQLIDRSAYTSISYGTHFDAQSFRFRIPEGSHVESATTVLAHGDGQTPLPRGMAFAPALPRELPDGYALLSWQYFLSNTQVPTFNWRLHDGLNTLSVFATDAKQAAKLPPDAKLVSLGSSNASLLESHGSRLLTWNAHGVSYTVVGHLPQADLLQIARSTL